MDDGCIVVGGGLAGLLCARRLQQRGRSYMMIDAPVTSLGSGLGGFAEFSGAKFSLLPAGSGLIPVAGSEEKLRDAMQEVVDLLGLGRFPLVHSGNVELESGAALALRPYDSFVLSPAEMSQLVSELSSHIPEGAVVRARVNSIQQLSDGVWVAETEGGKRFSATRLVFAGGRTGAPVLSHAGAVPQPGRGIDLGIRIEFANRAALGPLRALGADAKLLGRDCRTFCLNSPGLIFHYPVEGTLSVPGGVVADSSVPTGNVGILFRVRDKEQALARLRAAAAEPQGPLSYWADDHAGVIDPAVLSPFFGVDVVNALVEFINDIDESSLVQFDSGCTVHYPLVDWYWPTFAVSNSFATTRNGLYVVGDLAGHARGLLQSAVSGWLVGGAL